MRLRYRVKANGRIAEASPVALAEKAMALAAHVSPFIVAALVFLSKGALYWRVWKHDQKYPPIGLSQPIQPPNLNACKSIWRGLAWPRVATRKP